MKHFLYLSIVLVLSSCSTDDQKSSTQVVQEPEVGKDFYYQYDSLCFELSKLPKTYNVQKAELFFVKKWNTPDFLVDGSWTGRAWDRNIFYGCLMGDKVFFLDTISPHSEYFINEKGDASFIVEKYFPMDGGVTKNIYETAWMISIVQSGIEEFEFQQDFWQELMFGSQGRMSKEFEKYFIHSNNWKDQILSKTEKLNGKPLDAWTHPGYY
jgi:hypothetical protein